MAATDLNQNAMDMAPTRAADTPAPGVTQTSAVGGTTAGNHTPSRRRRNGGAGRSRPRSAEPSLPPDQRTVNILLPADTYEWFERQAAAAEFEPSLAKYLAWQLRRLEREQRATARTADRPTIGKDQTTVSAAAPESSRLPSEY